MADEKPKRIGVFSLLGMIFIRPFLNFAFPPLGYAIERKLWRTIPTRILEPSDYVSLLRRGEITSEEYYLRMAELGFDNEQARRLYNLSERLPQIDELIELALRGEISRDKFLQDARKLGFSDDLALKLVILRERLLPPEVVIRAIWRGLTLYGSKEKLIEELEKQGWTKEKIEVLEKVMKFYPSVDDFIRFMVKETFNEEVVRKYEYDEGYPKEIEPYVTKTGIDPEWIKHFWRAHWVLPSPQMGFEMLVRGLISMDDLRTLFRIAGYPPYWIDKLIKIAYHPFSRIDIRRMHKLGILTRDQVKRAYMDLGYDEEKAEALTRFTEELNNSEKKEERKEITEPTRNAILEQYEAKLITREEAKSMLMETDLSDKVAEFYLTLKDYEIEKKRVSKYTEALKKLYLNDLITEDEVADLFHKLNLPVDMIDETLTLWDLEKMGKVALPSKTDLINWLKKGKITEEEFVDEMSKLGYNQRYINLYLSAVK
jgi:hypothetical protein